MAGYRRHAREMQLPGPPALASPLQRVFSKANSACVPTVRVSGAEHMPGCSLQKRSGAKVAKETWEGWSGRGREEGRKKS